MSNGCNKEKEAAAAAAAAEADDDETQPLQPAVSTSALEKNCCEGGKVVILNIGGQRHEVLRKHFLERFANSRLWKVMRANTVEEILHHCDRYKVANSNDDVPEYFFDRNYTGFINILDAYRSGHLHLCASNSNFLSWINDEKFLKEPYLFLFCI